MRSLASALLAAAVAVPVLSGCSGEELPDTSAESTAEATAEASEQERGQPDGQGSEEPGGPGEQAEEGGFATERTLTPAPPSEVEHPPSTLPGLPEAAQARSMLEELTVAEAQPMTGYARDLFPHWRSEDGCTARESVLARDGQHIEPGEDCMPASGLWLSAFDNVIVDDPSSLDIDHMVPLANAWRSGAGSWDGQRREDFANDLDGPQLIAVTARSNREKGDQGPEAWRPIQAYWCEYSRAWTATKHTWELTVTASERDALEEMLGTCSE